MNKDEEKTSLGFYWVIPVAIVLMTLLYFAFGGNGLSKDHRYTSGTLLEVRQSFNVPFSGGSVQLYYSYDVEGQTYYRESGKFDPGETKFNIGDAFLVLFEASRPEESRIEYQQTISKGIIFPSQGIHKDSVDSFIGR